MAPKLNSKKEFFTWGQMLHSCKKPRPTPSFWKSTIQKFFQMQKQFFGEVGRLGEGACKILSCYDNFICDTCEPYDSHEVPETNCVCLICACNVSAVCTTVLKTQKYKLKLANAVSHVLIRQKLASVAQFKT